MEATELYNMAATISFTRQVQTKLNFKLLHAFGPQNTGQVETKVLLTVFNRINVASVTHLTLPRNISLSDITQTRQKKKITRLQPEGEMINANRNVQNTEHKM